MDKSVTFRPDQVLAASGTYAPKFARILKTLEDSCQVVGSDPALQVLKRSPASYQRIPDRILEIIAECLNKNGLGSGTPSLSPTGRSSPFSHGRLTLPGLNTPASTQPTRSQLGKGYAQQRLTAASLSSQRQLDSNIDISDTDEDIMSMSQLKVPDIDDSVSIASLTEEKSLLQKELHKASQLLSRMTHERQEIGNKYIAVSEQIEQSVLAQDRERAKNEQLLRLQSQLTTVSEELQKRDASYQRQIEAYRATQQKHARFVNTLKTKCLSYKSRSSQLGSLLKEQIASQEYLQRQLEASKGQLQAFSEQSSELTLTLKALQDQEMKNQQLVLRCQSAEQEATTKAHKHDDITRSWKSLQDEHQRLQAQLDEYRACDVENRRLKSCIQRISSTTRALKRDVHRTKDAVENDLVQTKEMLKTQMASVHSSASSALTMSGMQVNTLEVEIATLAEENRALKERLARQTDSHSDLTRKLTESERRYASLSTEFQQLCSTACNLEKCMSQGVLKHGKEAVDGSSAKGYDMIIAAQAELRASASLRKSYEDQCLVVLEMGTSVNNLKSRIQALDSQLKKESAEHDRHMSQLNQQVTNAQEYEARLAKDKECLIQDADVTVNQIAELNRLVGKQKDEIEASGRLATDLDSRLAIALEKHRSVSASNLRLTSELEQSRSDASALKAVLEQKQEQQRGVDQQHRDTVKALHEQLDTLQLKCRQLEEEKSSVAAELASRVASTDSLKQLAETRLEEVNMLQKAMNRLRQEKEQVNKEVREFQREPPSYTGLEEKCKHLEQQVENMKLKEESLTSSLSTASLVRQEQLASLEQSALDNKRLLTKVMQLEQQLRFSSLGDAVNSRKTASTSSLSSQDEAAGSEQHSMDIITNLEERLQRLTDQNELLAAESEAARSELVSRIGQLVTANDDCNDLRQQIRELKDQLQDMELSNKQSQKQDHHLTERLNHEVADLKKANSKLASKVAETADEFESALRKRESEVKLLSQSLAEATDKFEQADDNLQQALSRADAVSEDRDRLADELEKLTTAVQLSLQESGSAYQGLSQRSSSFVSNPRRIGRKGKVDIDDLVQHVERRSHDLKEVDSKLKKLSDLHQQAVQKEQLHERKLLTMESDMAALRSQLSRKENTIKDLTDFYDRKEAASSELSHDVNSMRGDLAASKRELETLSAVKESLKQALKTSEEQLLQANSTRLDLQLQISTLSGELNRCTSELKQLKAEHGSEVSGYLNNIKMLKQERDGQSVQISRQLEQVQEDRGHLQLENDRIKAEVEVIERQLRDTTQKLEKVTEHKEQEHQHLSFKHQETELRIVDSTRHIAELTNQLMNQKEDVQRGLVQLKETTYELVTVRENCDSLKKQLKRSKERYDKLEVDLNGSRQELRKLGEQLEKKEAEKQEMILAVEEMMSRERNLLARLNVADMKQYTLNSVREEMAGYTRERAQKLAGDGDSSASSLIRSLPQAEKGDAMRRKTSTRPEGSEARRTVSPLDRTPANGAGWGRASRQSDSSAASDDFTLRESHLAPASAMEQKLGHTELRAAELQARVLQLEEDNRALSSKVASQRDRMRHTAHGLSRNGQETRQIQAALRQSLVQVADADLDSYDQASSILAGESDDLSRTATKLHLSSSGRRSRQNPRYGEEHDKLHSSLTPRSTHRRPMFSSTPLTTGNSAKQSHAASSRR